MTQEIFYACEEGAVLVSDSLVIREREDGRRERLSRRKLFALGQQSAIVSGGAAIGIELSRELARTVQGHGVTDIDRIIAFAPGFLNTRYQAFLEQTKEWFEAHPNAYQRLYFLIAGWSNSRTAICTLMLGSERIDVPLEEFPISYILTMPRRLVLEMQLVKMAQTADLEEVADYCMKQLQLLAEKDPETVEGPFDGVIITPYGMRPAIAGA